MTPKFEWGKSDCLIDLFGDGIHDRLSFVKGDHNEVLGWVLSLSEKDRWHLFRSIAEGEGWFLVDKAEPGDGAIGVCRMGVSRDFELPAPWFAQMGIDCHWYVRMPWGLRTVDFDENIEVYRCRAPQLERY